MEKQRVTELGQAVEARLRHIYRQDGMLAKLWALLTFSATNAQKLAVWQQSQRRLEAALQHDNRKEAAAQLNLQALNCAIEATRRKDPLLTRYAEELRVLSQQARSSAGS